MKGPECLAFVSSMRELSLASLMFGIVLFWILPGYQIYMMCKGVGRD
jgi:hypothetical protein